MTTLAELVVQAPDDAHGNEIQIPATSGVWKFALQVADPLMGVDVVWFDFTQFYASDRYQRGASEYMGRYRAAVAQVHLTIDNVLADDLGVSVDSLAPWGFDTTPLLGENVTLDAGLLMRAVVFRVVSAATVEWHPLWTGRVETWGDAATARGQIRDHLIVVSDLIGDLVNVPTQVADPGGADWEVWLAEVLTQANWPFDVEIYGDDGSIGLPARTDVQPSAINELDAGSDPVGLVWRSLRSGKLVIHPAPWDTTHTERYDNPLLAVYPSGLIFNWNPDFTDIEYITDDDNEPAGLQRTSLGVINTVLITGPGGLYAIDSPTSQSKYGMRPYSASWIIDNDPVADDLLAARGDASQQALPLRTTIDHDGFFPAMAMVDHLDPVTFIHTSHESGPVVTAEGTVRTITEIRELRHETGLSWESTIQIDVTSSAAVEALLPVEDLVIDDLVEIFASFDWVNPTQPDVTPTEIQYRVLGQSIIWQSVVYDGVGAQGANVFGLDPATSYTFQVRIVRRVNGLITHTSPVREVDFTTPAPETPTPVPDDTDTDVDLPDVSDPDCEMELDLEENDGTGWVVVDSWDETDFVDNGDGTFSLITPIPNSFFNPGSIYRFVSREVCSGVPGPDNVGPSFDPPDDWADPCTTPTALSTPPFDSVDLLVYVPQICSPDIIAEAVSGIHGVHGSAYGGLLQEVGEPGRIAIEAIASPEWDDTSGIVAYGSCPQITGVVGSKSVSVRVNVPAAEFLTFWECSAMRITCTPSGSGWKAGATVFTPAGTGTCLSSELALHSAGDATVILATYDAATGDLKLYVDDAEDGDTTFGGPQNTINALPTWFAGAAPAGWIIDCATWEGIVETAPGVPVVVGTLQDNTNLDGAVDVVIKPGTTYAFVAAQDVDTVTVVDYSTPGSPTVVETFADGTNLNGVTKLVIVGNLLFCSASLGARLTILDISNPLSLSLVGNVSYFTTGPGGLAISGSVAVQLDASLDRVNTIDVSTPASPAGLDNLSNGTTLNQARNVAIKGSHALVAATLYDGVTSVTIATPTNTSVASTVTHANLNGAYDIKVDGNYAFVSARDADGLAVLDVTNPASLSAPIGFVTDATQLNDPRGLTIAGDHVYVACLIEERVTMVNKATPASPTIVGSVVDATALDGVHALDNDGSHIVAVSPTANRITILSM